jgi:ribosomal protein S6--L-glutamate ligase
VRDRKDVLPAIDRVGGAPVVIKLIEGTQGIGVLLAESVKTAEGIVELLQSQKQNVLIQKFVAESKGRDIRAFVVGDRVVAAMRRVAQGQEFRSNVHRGGIAEPIELSEEYSRDRRALPRRYWACRWRGRYAGEARTVRRSWK